MITTEIEKPLTPGEDGQRLDENFTHELDTLSSGGGQVEKSGEQPAKLSEYENGPDSELPTGAYGDSPFPLDSIFKDEKSADVIAFSSPQVIDIKASGSRLNLEDWPDPLAVTDEVRPEEFPLDALPDIVRGAAEEVLAFVKAPVPLVVSSALGAISLAIQAHVDVQRAVKLTGPVGLYLLTIADSGERKSSCDKYFTKAIFSYQQEQHKKAEPLLQKFKSEHDFWSARKNGLLDKAKQLSKTGKPVTDIEADLLLLEKVKPGPPKVPNLIRGDETPESLAWFLAHDWPSAGIISSEAGVVFGGQGMKKDSLMSYLAMLNVLWDGGEHAVGRKTSPSFTVRNARFTVALQVQEPTLRKFFEGAGGLARGTGFLARFLVAWPESTQGSRMFTEPPVDWPYLSIFENRITEILNMPVKLSEDGNGLSPFMLQLSDDAYVAWKGFHNTVEQELNIDGEYYDVRDVASKAADNVVRLAGLFHVFDGNNLDIGISLAHLESASKVVLWYLKEARRFLGTQSVSEEQKNVVMLNDWLVRSSQKKGSRKFLCREEIQQRGPRPLRKKEKLGPVIQSLLKMERIQLVEIEGKNAIEMNPKIFNNVYEDISTMIN